MQLRLPEQKTVEKDTSRLHHIIMGFYLAMFTAFFLLFTAALSAPTGSHDACADVRHSALKFNQIAKMAQNGSKGIIHFSTSLAWMEAKDMCDPGTLSHEPGPCMEKILYVLTSYKSFVTTVAEFESCSIAREVKPVLNKLHEDVRGCVKNKNGPHHLKAHYIDVIQTLDTWEKELLCHYTMERLFSFSILTARVFSVGDPKNHTGPTAVCTPN